jgi:hypothetical protein
MAQPPSTWTFVAEGDTKELPLADLTLTADDSSIRVHRGLVLSLSSKFAATTLAGKELMLPGKTGAEVGLLVGWMYHQLRVEDFTLDIVKQLVSMATEYEMPALLKDVDGWLCREVEALRIVKNFQPATCSSAMQQCDYVRLWPSVFPGADADSIVSTCPKGHHATAYGHGGTFFTIGGDGTFLCRGCSSKQYNFADRILATQKAALEAAFASESAIALASAGNKATAETFSELLLLARTYKLTDLTRLLCGMLEKLQPSHAQLVLVAYVVAEMKSACSAA